MRNPHFDDNLVIWSDKYSGRYEAPAKYDDQFDLQWKLALDGNQEYYVFPGASVEDIYIADRVYEWTGKHPNGTGFHDATAGTRKLDRPVDPELIRGKECIDIGCGLGRWTRTMQAIGAKSVTSIDVSASALASTSRFNPNTHKANIMNIPEEHPEWVGKFDFANFWGVAMCTHDPLKAFLSAASTVKPGGSMYLMVYTLGLHSSRETMIKRKRFHRLKTVEERLAFVDTVFDRKWSSSFPLDLNLRIQSRNLRRLPKGGKSGVLDLLEPFYNWTIPLDVIKGWTKKAGFSSMTVLNEFETRKCAYHVLLTRRAK